MSRVQLALRVGDLAGSIEFYTKLFGTEPAKLRPGYANFTVAAPPLKLVLLEGEPGQATAMDHLGVEVADTDTVHQATQDKVWVHGPGHEPWEVYVVKNDSPVYGQDNATTSAACCTIDDVEDAATA